MSLVDLIYENTNNKKSINWDEIEQIIIENKDGINELVDAHKSTLSTCYSDVGFCMKGKDALHLTELFLKNGFDVYANNEWNGARIRGLRFQSAAEASLSFDNGFRLKANNSDRHGGDIWRVNRRKRDSNT